LPRGINHPCHKYALTDSAEGKIIYSRQKEKHVDLPRSSNFVRFFLSGPDDIRNALARAERSVLKILLTFLTA
jgi:hypothetical protein